MSIDSHLSELVRRHQAIEEAIVAEVNHPASDDTKIHELKRKKLHLKDEIERLKQLVGFGVVETDLARLVRHHDLVNTWNVQRALWVLEACN